MSSLQSKEQTAQDFRRFPFFAFIEKDRNSLESIEVLVDGRIQVHLRPFTGGSIDAF